MNPIEITHPICHKPLCSREAEYEHKGKYYCAYCASEFEAKQAAAAMGKKLKKIFS